MTSFDNALKSDEGNSVYPPDLAKAIFELDIPDRIYLKTAMEFDDKYIVNKGNKWTFDYSGSRRYLIFNQDYISNKLNKYICFKYASTRFPTKLPALHLDWRNIISYCREHGGFSLKHELQLMLVEGFDKSPISAKALHIRLKAKGIVNGGLSTLSSLERKRLIAAYVDQQLGPLNLRPKEKQQYVNRKTRQALLARNQQLQAEVSELRDQLAQNTLSLIEIVKAVKINSVIPVESLLANHMIRELHKSS